MPRPEEAWCRTPSCAWHGVAVPAEDLRCAACRGLLATAPAPPPPWTSAPEPGEALA